MKISVSGKSDIGLERANNEDYFSFCPDLTKRKWNYSSNEYVKIGRLGAISIVADGMGGANAGEIASTIAVETIKRELSQSILLSSIDSEDKVRSCLLEFIKKANNAILKHIETDPETIGMGTTIVILWILHNKAFIAWCGDSRCYVFNPKYGLKCLTKDHSYVQELIDRGEMSVKESYKSPDNCIITRCIGDRDVSAEPEIVVYNIQRHDQFLLCSDGLSAYCSDNVIEHVYYNKYLNITDCCNALIELANKAGGRDNITVLCISTIDDDEVKIPFNLWNEITRQIKMLWFKLLNVWNLEV